MAAVAFEQLEVTPRRRALRRLAKRGGAMFGLAVTHLSYLFFVALPPALAIALAIHRGALTQAMGHWWRWRPSWRSLAWAAGC